MQKQSINNSNSQDNANNMVQLFGNELDNQKNKIEMTTNTRNTINVEKLPLRVTNSMLKKSFIGAGVIFGMEAILMIVNMQILYFIGTVILMGLSFLLAKKVNYRYEYDTNYFIYNLTVTLKGVINHFRTTSILMEASEKLFIYSIVVMAIQHYLLSWFSLTSILYSIAYYGMFIGIVLNFAKRKTELLSKGLYLYAILLALMTIQNVIFYQYINFHTSVSLLFFLYLAGLFKSFEIKEVHIDNVKKETTSNQKTQTTDIDELI